MGRSFLCKVVNTHNLIGFQFLCWGFYLLKIWVILEISEGGNSSFVGSVELQNFSSNEQVNLYIKNVCTTELNTCGSRVLYYSAITEGESRWFPSVVISLISPFYQLYLFSTDDSVIILKLELYLLDLNLFSSWQHY